MTRGAVDPVFVSRQTAAARLEISVDTFDTWLRSGFLPAPQIDRGQIVRWHWPSIEKRLAGDGESQHHDPFMAGIQNVAKGRRRAAA